VLYPQQPLRRDNPHDVRQVLAARLWSRLYADQGQFPQPVLRPHRRLRAGTDPSRSLVVAQIEDAVPFPLVANQARIGTLSLGQLGADPRRHRVGQGKPLAA